MTKQSGRDDAIEKIKIIALNKHHYFTGIQSRTKHTAYDNMMHDFSQAEVVAL